ncbi:MAG: PD40 domain-containing protein [Planctomycetes bacterium]|nr:PD40 domain-containing protein [Planctomycetota bacterium]
MERHYPWAGALAGVVAIVFFNFEVAGARGETPPPSEAKLLPAALAGPLAGVEDIVFAVRQPGKDGHWYANFGYYAEGPQRVTYGEGGRLCRLGLRTGRLTVLLDDSKGGVRDPQVRHDGRKILFSYRKGGSTSYNLYEIEADGSGLKQLTDGPYDDLEPAYLPDGDIVFCSSRANRWVNCWLTKVAILYRCDGEGKNLRLISSNNEHDNTPAVLPDGRILYTRWEYVDRSQVHYHHLWTVNPDGTNQMVFYGNLHPGITMIDARPIPGSQKIVSIFSPGHGLREHAGKVTVVDPRAGPDDRHSARAVHPAENFRDPWPLSEEYFLAARGPEIDLLDGRGAVEILYRLPEEDRRAGLHCHEPVPLCRRDREHVIPSRVQPEEETGKLVLANVYEGRNMAGVQRGEITKLLILETLPKPINFTGGMEPLSYGGTFTLERILGTVPVEEDGSAYMEVPALRSLFFVALDGSDLSVKRMQSFVTVQPGEVTSCLGCHEQRTRAPLPSGHLMALRRPPSRIEPIADAPEVLDFPRDLQPILDRHCVPCHDYEKTGAGGPRAGGVLLTGDHGPMFSHSYYMLTVRRQFADGRNLPQSNYAPRALGSSGSPLMKKIEGAHYGVRLSERERKLVRLWIETGAAYPGTYAALGTGMIGGYAENQIDRSDTAFESVKAAREAMGRRCGGCHQGAMRLPESPSDHMEMPPWAILYNDPRIRYSRHIIYNLSRPEKSLLLLAPLAPAAGGYGLCGAAAQEKAAGAAMFESAADADYEKLLASIRDTKGELDRRKRFDMPGFRPHPAYIREMQNYGILSRDLDPARPLDPYALDRAYWRSLWYQPRQGPASVDPEQARRQTKSF